jgi:putative ABC transport system permease protein
MTRLRFIAAMAWRETRASRRRLLLFAAAISIGVAALVAISSFTANLESAVKREARTLLGADLVIGSNRPFSRDLEAALDSAQRAGVPVTRRTTFSSMAWVQRIPDRSRLAEVRAVGPGFPFYGQVVTAPAGRWSALDTGRVAIVDTSLLVTLDAVIGDSLELGSSRFLIAATVTDVPGHLTGGVNAFGAQVYIPDRYIRETGLITFGSRARYQALLRFDTPADARRFESRQTPLLRRDNVRSETVSDAEDDLGEAIHNMESFLQFVGLIALLLGGIGVASGITAFLAGKLETIAVLRCLGARRPLVFGIYLAQAVALGLIAAAAGVSLGVGLQFLLPRLLTGVLPLDVQVRLEPLVILGGIGLGLAVSVLFALRPLLEIRLVSPLQAIRKDYESATEARRDPWRLLATGLLAVGIFVLAMGRNDDPRIGIGFAVAILAAVMVLTLAARLVVWASRRATAGAARRGAWPYVVRQGIANLHRPRNQTRAVVTALGFGVGLLATLYLVQANFLRQVFIDTAANVSRPNLVFVDAQSDQAPALQALVDSSGFPVLQAVPMIPMRIAAVNGRTAAELLRDTGMARPAPWTLRREYRSTFRDSLVGSEKLVSGAWWAGTGEATRPEGAPPAPRTRRAARLNSGRIGTAVRDTFDLFPVSLSTDVATDLKVGIGDRVTWNVQGQMVRTRIVALREVDWARFEPNFFAVFSSAGMREAPASWVVLTRVEDSGARARLQREAAERFPNVIAFDVAVVQRTIERIFGKIALAVRFMAGLSLATGTLVLLGAVAAGRLQRIREGALLKALGATRRQLTRILLSEYLALGTLAAVVGIGLSALGGWAFTKWVLELPFVLPVPPLVGVLAVTAALVTIVGLTASREVFRRTAMEVLRE